ncbi:MAG: maleylpyruvate isomerase family mycothiol-dependent enzyme [Actinomycetota bacterium]|nr:maleylpyruvate isomerase family mycothiol-dependent enzyme [Actinomycetota bacterium]
MPGEPIERRLQLNSVCNALEKNTRRLTSLMRNVTTPEAGAIGTWSLHDVALHVTDGMENYAKRVQEQPASELDEIRNMARWNLETVDRLLRRPLEELADRMNDATEQFLAVSRAMDHMNEVPWYAGFRIPVVVAIAMRLVEHIVHGYDIATASGQAWPIATQDAVAMSYGLAYISPRFVDAQHLAFDGTIEMRLRGGAPYFFVIEDRSLRVETDPPGPVGFHISADPVAWILVSTGRASSVRATLTGKMIGWGMRPLLPLKLQRATFQG